MLARARIETKTALLTQKDAPQSSEVAVIDIGSNSVRLVVYRLDGRAVIPILNEKMMAGLGRDMPRTGKLSPEGVENALDVLKRFATITECIDLDRIDVVATAAVREAKDGAEFVARVKKETGFSIRVIPGSEEARLSALGVLAGLPEADGMVGDLGGSSLELIAISPKGPGAGETFNLGPFALMREEGFNDAHVTAVVDGALARATTLNKQGGTFYAVGGAWRALGRIHMALHDHPLHVLQHYEMSRADVLELADIVRRQSKRSLERMFEAAARRADLLPYAAIVLERVMQRGAFENVVLSSYGLREGVLYEHMNAGARAQHPLIASAEAFGAQVSRAREFGRALGPWVEPVFAKSEPVFAKPRDKLLREAACRLADVGGPLHPDQRAELMFDLVIRAPLSGLSHPERAFIATAVHHRYTKTAPANAPAFDRLLTEEQQQAAFVLGNAMRLGADVSGRSEAVLALFRLGWEKGALVLKTPQGQAHLVNEQSLRRLTALGASMGVETKVAG
ncbi:MAG: Ppx/GppA family phosphatase [Hyphomonadaceae bacterium]